MDNLLAMWSSAKRRRGCHGYPHAARSINDQPNPSQIGVQVVVESLSRSSWNHCPDPRGIAVQLGVEYAEQSQDQRIDPLMSEFPD